MRLASALILTVACGGPLAGDVTVRVFEGRDISPEAYAPVAGVLVAAHAPDGVAIAVGRTDAHGQVTFSEVPPDGSVTIAEPHALRSLYTVFGVQPGDVIDVPVERSPASWGWLMTRWEPYPGAARYRLFDGCDEAVSTTSGAQRLDVDGRCLSPWRSASSIVVAEDARGRELAYAAATGITVENDREAEAAVGAWTTQLVDISARIPAAPWAAKTNVQLRRYDGTGTHVYPIDVAPASIPAGMFDEVVVRHSQGNRSVVLSIPLTAKSAVAADATPPALDIEPPVVDGSDVAPVLHTRALGASADMLTGVVRWAHVRWTFVAAPDATTIAFPALPSELAPFTPRAHRRRRISVWSITRTSRRGTRRAANCGGPSRPAPPRTSSISGDSSPPRAWALWHADAAQA